MPTPRKSKTSSSAARDRGARQPRKTSLPGGATPEEEPATLFHVVGIGASAGGFEALESFFDNMPPDNGMAFVVVQHLSPDYKSLMVELLSKHTAMAVRQVENDMAIEPATVYLLPPKKNMTVFNGRLLLVDKAPKQTLSFPIDIFFNSLAEDLGERAIAVILSGTGSDGTRGIRTVKESGGMVMVQDVASAKFDGMPRNAIATDLVDFILPPHEMPVELLRYVKHPYALDVPAGDGKPLREEDRLANIFQALKGHTGIDFTFYKQNTVLRRIERRMRVAQIERIGDYANYLLQNPGEVHTLYKELLIGVTRFFRDSEAFDVIRDKALPEIFRSKPAGEPVRIWTAGCSTGEEAYSLAMLCREHLEATDSRNEVKIFATDVDRDALEYASQGRYPESIAADLAEDRLKRFFVRKGDRCEVSKDLREMVIFAMHNIIKDPPFNKIDLLVCRNMLIYLQPVLQQKALLNFNFALNEGGILFLGSSETVGNFTNLYSPLNTKWKVYRCRGRQAPIFVENPGLPSPARRRRTVVREPDAATAARLGARTMFDIAYDALFRDYIPPSIVVNRRNQLVHAFGEVDRYLKIHSGAVTLDITTLLRKELAAAFETGMNKAFRDGKPTEYRDVRLHDEQGERKRITLRFVPYTEKAAEDDLMLVAFEEIRPESGKAVSDEARDGDSGTQQRIEDLESELQYTRENLQATIEELEATNEELQATNEELLSANEELQSTNEELQSVNEELITVNAEYQGKIEELTDLNNDMHNLLSSTNVGTVFLDTQLKIRKFTPAVREAINLMESDLGRPIAHIALNAGYTGLVEDARSVMDTLQPIEREVRTNTDRWLLLRMQPYRTEDNAIRGVVLTFVDVTRLKETETALRKLSMAVEHAPASIVIASPDLSVEYVNRAFTEHAGLSAKEVLGKSLKGLAVPVSENKANAWKRLAAGETWNGLCVGKSKGGEELLEEVTLAPIRDDSGTVLHYLKLGRDVTRNRQVQEELRAEHELRERIVESSPVGITLVDQAGKIVFANPQAKAILGVVQGNATNRTYNDPAWSITDLDGQPYPKDELPFERAMRTGGPVYDVRHAIIAEKGRRKALSINASPVKDASGKIVAVVNSLMDITEQQEAEAELRRHRERLEEMVSERTAELAGVKQHLDALDVIFLGLDSEGKVSLVNRKGLDILGVQEKDVLGSPWFERFVPKEERTSRRTFEKILAGKEGPQALTSFKVLSANGQALSVAWNCKLLYGAGGGIAGMLCSGKVLH